MKQEKIKTLLNWAGIGLSVLGVTFVGERFWQVGGQIGVSGLSSTLWFTLIALSCMYGASNLLLALAWNYFLKHLQVSADPIWAIRAFGKSHLAKYVPGNIFHLAGRQALGVSAGLPAWALVKSMVMELAIISVAGFLFAFLAMPFLWENSPPGLGVVGFLCSCFLFGWIAFRFFSRWVLNAFGFQIVFLMLSGLAFAGVFWTIAPDRGIPLVDVLPICGAYVFAWVLGLVTPGAPAGAGVREVVVFALLQSFGSESELLTAILLGRLVTVVGDVLFFFAVLFLLPPRATPVAAH